MAKIRCVKTPDQSAIVRIFYFMSKETKVKKVVELTAEEELAAKAKKDSLMSKFLNDSATPANVGDVVEGKVIGIEKSAVYIDLPPFGTGIIYGKEFINTRDVIKKLNIGDSVAAKIVDMDNKEGYIELSLKERSEEHTS